MNRTVAIVATLVALFSFFVGGCESKPKMGKWDLVITPDESLKGGAASMPFVQVDLVGVRTDEVPNWTGYSVNKYFSGDDSLRQVATKEGYAKQLTFDASDNKPKTIAISDDIWNKWDQTKGGRGALHLVVIAKSLNMAQPSAGAVDSRRLVLPLDSRTYKSGPVEIKVTSSGVQSPTPQQPLK